MTAYTRSEIAELSINQLINSELDEALTAFNGFSGIFGRGWIDDYFHGAQSPIFVRSIMAMWKDFQTVSHLAKIEKLLERWRHGINQQGVSAELRVLAQLCRVGFDLELFPPVARREPDACVRVTREQPWTYVEVSQRAISELRSHAESVMVRISERAADSRPGIHSKIAVLRQPGADELERILRWLDSLPASGSQLEDLAALYLEPIETAVDANDVLYQHVPEPRLFNSRIAFGTSAKKATVCIRVEDTGAEQMLRSEARQLPSSPPGIVVLDISSIIGSLESWAPLIGRRFQPQINTRVGAVILTQCYNANRGRECQSRILTNPYAPIDPDIIGKLERAFPPEFKADM